MSSKLIKIILGTLLTLSVYATDSMAGTDRAATFLPYAVCVVLLVIIACLLFKLKRANSKTAKVDDVLSIDEAEFAKRIDKGLENGEFKMYLQPVVDNKEKRIVSAEALSRWEDNDGCIVSPAKYIWVMEKHGLIAKLDYYMFDMACKKLVEWQGTEFDEITLSCNFTRITISERDFATKISSIADKYSFDRSKLWLEITEDAVEKNLDTAKQNILKVKELGFKIALDDIGAGYTSFINLCEYPLDVVKIDRDILQRTDRERGKKLFFGMISLAHSLNLEVVCEGVETEEQSRFVSDSDCDYIQGWYYAKPMPEEKAEAFIKEYRGV